MNWLEGKQVIILCAGEGRRMGTELPKVLMPVDNKPLLEHVVEYWRNFTDKLIFVVNNNSHQVTAEIMALSLTYQYDASWVYQNEQKGILDAVLCAIDRVEGRFAVTLGDCLFKGDFMWPEDMKYGIAYDVYGCQDMRDNFSLELGNGDEIIKSVWAIKEKPHIHTGCGAYFFHSPDALDINPMTYGIDWDMLLRCLIKSAHVTAVPFYGVYHNINQPIDIVRAECKLKQYRAAAAK